MRALRSLLLTRLMELLKKQHGRRAFSRLAELELFDPAFYVSTYADIAVSGMDPLFHYVAHGEAEGRRPNPLFDPFYYRTQNPDVAKAGMGLLAHYEVHGEAEGRRPHPLFDPVYYRRENPDVAKAGVGLLMHYQMYGEAEGRRPNPVFDPAYYRTQNPDVAEAGVGLLAHYDARGDVEDRDPHPMFNSRYFRSIYPHCTSTGTNPLTAFLADPACDGRHPHPLFDAAYQAATTPLALHPDRHPLEDYFLYRSPLQSSPLKGGTSCLPKPLPSHLPNRNPRGDAVEVTLEPLISIVMPTYNSDAAYLMRAIDSVCMQTYGNWELIVVDDGSFAGHMPGLLDDIAVRDGRIKVIAQAANGGISRATNVGLAAAGGQYVALVDHDDVLDRTALAEVVRAIDATGADVIYTDQAYVHADGTFASAFHKPGWSPVLLCGVMYVGHLLVVRRDLAIDSGGFDPGFDRVQDFEFMLRVGEHAHRVLRIPKVLYEWRRAPGSIALDANAKGKIEPIQQAAVNAHLARTGVPAQAVVHERLPHRLRIVPNPRGSRPAIDLILRGDRPEALIEVCRARLEGMYDGRTTVLVSSRGTSGGARDAAPTNLATAISVGRSPYLLMVDPGATAPVGDWIDHLLLYIERKGFAFAGPQLVASNDRVVAAGLIVDANRGLVPAFAGVERGSDGYAGALACNREVSALPYSYLLAKREALSAVGPASRDYADLDYVVGELTYRATLAGLTNVAVASISFEMPIGTTLLSPADADRWIFVERHRQSLSLGDRYYNPNFTHRAGTFQSRV